jgi:hypothetical protein
MNVSETAPHVSADEAAQLLAQLAGISVADAISLVRLSARWPTETPDDGFDVGPKARQPRSTADATVDADALATALASTFGCPIENGRQLAARAVGGAPAQNDEPQAAWRHTVFRDEPLPTQRKKATT